MNEFGIRTCTCIGLLNEHIQYYHAVELLQLNKLERIVHVTFNKLFSYCILQVVQQIDGCPTLASCFMGIFFLAFW